jgi:hypothetical protein
MFLSDMRAFDEAPPQACWAFKNLWHLTDHSHGALITEKASVIRPLAQRLAQRQLCFVLHLSNHAKKAPLRLRRSLMVACAYVSIRVVSCQKDRVLRRAAKSVAHVWHLLDIESGKKDLYQCGLKSGAKAECKTSTSKY